MLLALAARPPADQNTLNLWIKVHAQKTVKLARPPAGIVPKSSELKLGTSTTEPILFIVGVTLAECKSGYGVDFDTEVRMLRVINRALKDPEVKIDISVTYCGAHAIARCVG